MKDFKDKIAFITGGGSGAGLGQAKVFSEAGCKIVIADIRDDHLEEAREYFRAKNADVHCIKLDITDREAYAAAADEVESVYGGPPQLLFNTAGVNAFGPCEASTYEDYDWIMGVDLGGVINGMVTFVPRMIQAGKGGHIATVASWGGFSLSPGCTPYSVAKMAVVGLMEMYYQALQPYGIGVSCLCPVGIKSNIGESSYTRPENLANTGYNTNETTIDFMRYHYSFGIDPVDLAKIFKKGIENEQLIVLPFDDPEQMMRDTMARWVDYCTPEGTKKQNELRIARRADMLKNVTSDQENPMKGADKAGWGKANPDITWVKDDRFK